MTEETINAYRILLENLLARETLRPTLRWRDNIKIVLMVCVNLSELASSRVLCRW